MTITVNDYKYKEKGHVNFLKAYSSLRNVESWQDIALAEEIDVANKVWAECFGIEYIEGYALESKGEFETTYINQENGYSFTTDKISLSHRYDRSFMEHFHEYSNLVTKWRQSDFAQLQESYSKLRSRIMELYEKGYFFGVDTNILMDAPAFLSFFPDTERLIISRTVYEELDGLKKDTGKRGQLARRTIRAIEKHQLSGKALNFIAADKTYIHNNGLLRDSKDDLIIGTYLKEKENWEKVVFASNDRGARVIAHSAGLETISLTEESFDLSEMLATFNGETLLELGVLLDGKEIPPKNPVLEITDEDIRRYYAEQNILPLSELEVPEKLTLFLNAHTDFRGEQITWQELMKIDRQRVEQKVKAERYGYSFLKGYSNTSSEVLFPTQDKNYLIPIELGYDEVFMATYEVMGRRKHILNTHGGTDYIEKVSRLKENLSSHFNEGGYLAIDTLRLEALLPWLEDNNYASHLLISENTWNDIRSKAFNSYSDGAVIFDTISHWLDNELMLPPLKENPQLVSKRKGLLVSKNHQSSWSDLEISSFLPLLYDKNPILYLGNDQEQETAEIWKLPVYHAPSGLNLNFELAEVIKDNAEDLTELAERDVFFEEKMFDYNRFLYPLN